jgi:hypothetical protein
MLTPLKIILLYDMKIQNPRDFPLPPELALTACNGIKTYGRLINGKIPPITYHLSRGLVKGEGHKYFLVVIKALALSTSPPEPPLQTVLYNETARIIVWRGGWNLRGAGAPLRRLLPLGEKGVIYWISRGCNGAVWVGIDYNRWGWMGGLMHGSYLVNYYGIVIIYKQKDRQ